MQKDKKSLYVPILVVLLLVASFFVGRLSAQVSSLKGGKAGTDSAATPTPTESKISVANLKVLAKGLGLDTKKFNTCLDSGQFAQKVADQQKEGQSFGIGGTPSFMINGLLVVGSLPQTDFEKVIDAELKNGSGAAAATTVTGGTVTRQTVDYGTGYVKGNKDAKVKIMEFTDFECPYCAKSFPTIEALLTKYGNNINLEYRSFPLPAQMHPDAQKAAEAALCAGDQGKFWEMHDKMFTVMGQQ